MKLKHKAHNKSQVTLGTSKEALTRQDMSSLQ